MFWILPTKFAIATESMDTIYSAYLTFYFSHFYNYVSAMKLGYRLYVISEYITYLIGPF